MKVIETTLPGVMLIKPDINADARGFLLESYQKHRYEEIGITNNFVQDNHSHSIKGVLRGMHYQLKNPQGKLISVIKGEVFDVAVDIRYGSPNYGQWYGVNLSDENHYQVYIPEGFAHGFCVLSESTDIVYKCTDYYSPEDERAVIWNDPDIAIDWPINSIELSKKDSYAPKLADVPPDQLPVYRD